MTATAIGAAIGVGFAAAGLARAFVPPTPRLAPRVRPYQHIARAALGLPPDVERDGRETTIVGGLFGPPLMAAARKVGRVVESRGDEEVARALLQAGRVASVDDFRLRQVATGAAAAIAFGLVGTVLLPVPVLVLAFVITGFVWGSARVRAEVDRAVEARRARLRLELATVSQLLALHVRTGAGPVQAVQRFVDRGLGAVAEELRGVVTAVRQGTREADAFRRAAELTPAPESARVHLLFANGAERGSDLAAALLAVADDLREARRDEVRRATIRSRAAMLLPTIGILAPVMLLFIAAPLPSIVMGAR